MKIAKCFGLLLFLSAWACAQNLGTDPQVSALIRKIRAEVNANEALDFVVRLHESDRWGTFPKFQQTALYLQRTMEQLGLRSVEMDSAPADGVTQVGFWTMPLAWDVRQARLEIVEPEVPPGMRVLADYGREPASLIMWSGATPPGGVTAEVVELRSGSARELAGLDVKGKMVLVELPRDLAQRGALKAALYKRGAAGVMSCLTESPDVPDGHYWVNAWSDAGWGFTKTSSPLVGFSLTPRQSAFIRGLLARGTPVRVKAVADTRYYAGRYPWATGVVPGSDGEEEVLELGHAFEIGAQDNASGVAAMLEAAAALTRLIEAGRLPRPRRGIRILVMPEDYGSSAYIAAHMDRMKRTIGAICMDTAAGAYDTAGAYSFAMNPDVSRSYQDALILRIAETYYAELPRRFPRWSPYRPTSDSYLSDPMIGVPTIAASGSSGAVGVHHNSADTVDRVDPRSLRDLSSMVAAFLYYLASAGDREIPWLAEITADRAAENAIRAAAPYLGRAAAAANAEALGRELHDGVAQITYHADRDRDALLSVLRLASPGEREKIRRALNPLLKSVRQFSDLECERLRAAVSRRAAELAIPLPVEAIPPKADPRRAEAARMIVTRKRFGPVTLDDLPLEQREGFPGFAGNPAPLPLLTWCDGKRTLAEVIRLVELERGAMDFDFVGYFRFLARHGYVGIIAP